MKKITLYRSRLCPRCKMAGKHLHELQEELGTFTIDEVDILTNPSRTWQAGIRMIPALKTDNRVLSGLYLTKQAIRAFVTGEKKRK